MIQVIRVYTLTPNQIFTIYFVILCYVLNSQQRKISGPTCQTTDK